MYGIGGPSAIGGPLTVTAPGALDTSGKGGVGGSGGGDPSAELETDKVNERALAVVQRIQTKLTGRDFSDAAGVLSVSEQVCVCVCVCVGVGVGVLHTYQHRSP